jgi:sterol desaturase/sphingolipid hydroxylase (fatty acid hydroxylase superfamily)
LAAVAGLWWESFAANVPRYLAVAGAVALLLEVGLRRTWSHRRIPRSRSRRHDRWHEILLSLRAFAVFAAGWVAISWLDAAGVVALYDNVSDYGWGYLVGSTVAIVVAHDAYFYWVHRLAHLPRFYRRLYRGHHRFVAPSPFAAYAMDVGDAVINGSFAVLFPIVLPTHAGVLSAFVAFQVFRNVTLHADVELHPGWITQGRWFGWLTTTTHHALHHAGGPWNYGLYFTWWDRWMGTEHPQYRARLAALVRPAQGYGALPADTSSSASSPSSSCKGVGGQPRICRSTGTTDSSAPAQA